MGDAKDELAGAHLGTERDILLNLGLASFLDKGWKGAGRAETYGSHGCKVYRGCAELGGYRRGRDGGGAGRMSDFGGPEDAGSINTGIVDTSSANRRVWLVKVPDYLAERLADLEEDGLELGVVRAVPNEGHGGAAQVKLVLSPNGPCGDLPSEYTMQLGKCEQTMHLFCEDVAGRALMIEGKVEQECQLKPVLNEQYREVMRRRNELANRPRRSVQLVDTVGENMQMGLIPHVSEYQMLLKRKRRYEPDLRKERLPREEVTDMLFRAFERIAHWTFRALVEHTQQPSTYLKEVLADIAIYNNRGPYKNLYELKPEYKKT